MVGDQHAQRQAWIEGLAQLRAQGAIGADDESALIRHMDERLDAVQRELAALVPEYERRVETDGREAADSAARLDPDVVLMDVRMPRLDGVETTRRLLATSTPPRVIVLTTFDLDEYAFAAIRAGASAFLLKDAAPPDLLGAIRAVMAGDAVVAPSTTRRLLDHFAALPDTSADAAPADDRLALLTDREVEVLVRVGLERQVDRQPDRARARRPRAAVGRLHRAGAAPGDHREAGGAERAPDLDRQRVRVAPARRAGRAEHRHRRPDAAQRREALAQLAGHALDAVGVGDLRRDGREVGGEELLVGVLRVTCGFAGQAISMPHGAVLPH